ncbi:glycosyltransferase [Histidinibacterium lentulum]|uniref:Glycosyltransferase n=1 Tax=Histidinibacterium lentulum TaxID=2480588 RepID=A0A3N2R881_9RHOB|nr:glycosyltransferase [Histidinibacterium lentulum]ROU03679.1 glycosyltransferase [Histidinibacterium lentulum]
MALQLQTVRRRQKNEQKVVLAFCSHDDAHLVPAMLANLSPAVHAWVAWDDRRTPADGEPARRRILLDACRAMEAQWILVADPDERYEDRLASRMRQLCRRQQDIVWSFGLRELYAPDRYRSDGFWNRKTRACLFPVTDCIHVPDKALHGHWFSYRKPRNIRPSGLDFYHLRMIDPARRQARWAQYASIDPERRFQKIGYDYLIDERSLRLTAIPPDRRYSPGHVEDHGLWGTSPPSADPPRDTNRHRFFFLQRLLAPDCATQRMLVIRDILSEAIAETDGATIMACAAWLCAEGESAEALALLESLPASPARNLLLARTCRASGDLGRARGLARAVTEALPESRIARTELRRLREASGDFDGEDALWRRWVPGAATLRTGPGVVTDAPLTVVVIGFRAPAELGEAVSSLLAQDVKAEIVVVNSGGGDAARRLGPRRDQVRLIEVADPLYVGAARNIGIDASRAPVVAFLAADCLAAPGWVRQRLEGHRQGAAAVDSRVIADRPRSLAGLALSAWLHWPRWPGSEAEPQGLYGLSYDRRVFERYGYFSPDLRVAEDTHFNRRLQGREVVRFGTGVLTLHRYPRTVPAMLLDAYRRGKRTPAILLDLMKPPAARLQGFRRRRASRHLLAREASLRIDSVGRIGKAIIRQLIRAVSHADLVGLRMSVRIFDRCGELGGKAEAALEAGRPAEALTAARTARDLAPQESRYHLLEALALSRLDPPVQQAEVIAAFRRAAGLDPAAKEPHARLYAHLLESDPGTALRVAEEEADRAPHEPAHALAAAEAATRLGLTDLADLYARFAFFSAPWSPDCQALHDSLRTRRDAPPASLRSSA